MHVLLMLVGVMLFSTFAIDHAFAQTEINVTQSNPCFLNYTAGVQMWENCGYKEDWLSAIILPFEWVTGGLFSMIIVSVLIIMTYMKYNSIIYPIGIGIVFLPMSFFLFPEWFVTVGVIFAFLGVGALIWYIFVRQTKEY